MLICCGTNARDGHKYDGEGDTDYGIADALDACVAAQKIVEKRDAKKQEA